MFDCKAWRESVLPFLTVQRKGPIVVSAFLNIPIAVSFDVMPTRHMHTHGSVVV